jgi:hypothetical protein
MARVGKSKSWSEVMGDWIPRWFKRPENRKVVVDSEIQFNTVKPRCQQQNSVWSAPADIDLSHYRRTDENDNDEFYDSISYEIPLKNQSTPKSDLCEKQNNRENDIAHKTYSKLNPNAPVYTQQQPGFQPKVDDRRYENRNKQPNAKMFRRHKEPDKFDGEKIDWLDYLQHFETVAYWNGWNFQEKALQLSMSLTGEAQRVFNDIAKYIPLYDFDALVNELGHRFNPIDRESTFRFEFRNRLRLPNESVMQFGYALLRLANKAFPNISREAQEEWVLDQFITGLKNIETAKHVQFGHPRNIHEAIKLATEYESFEKNAMGKKFVKPANGQINAVGNLGIGDPYQKSVSDLNEKVDKSLTQINELSKQVKELVNLPQNTSNSNQYKRQNQNKGKDLSKIMCFRCKEMGHFSNNCPKAKSDNRVGQNNSVSQQSNQLN